MEHVGAWQSANSLAFAHAVLTHRAYIVHACLRKAMYRAVRQGCLGKVGMLLGALSEDFCTGLLVSTSLR